MNDEENAIASVLQEYEVALNASDTSAVMKLYAVDGVFMPQNFGSSIGTAAVRGAYEGVFAAIQLAVKFEVQEIHTVSPSWAFARTNSAGQVTVHATGGSSAEANQELFVMQKTDGQWKIARYCFCTTLPPRT